MLLKLIVLTGVIYFVVRLQGLKKIDKAEEDNGEEFVDYEEVDD